MRIDFLREQMTQEISKILERKYIEADNAISTYMMKNHLTTEDLVIFGIAEHMLDAEKIVYKYKDDIICAISYKIEMNITGKKLIITTEETI